MNALNKSLGALEEGKRGSDGRLASAQTALMLQEETIRRCEREKKALSEKVKQFCDFYFTFEIKRLLHWNDHSRLMTVIVVSFSIRLTN